jgi:hypothetical protein
VKGLVAAANPISSLKDDLSVGLDSSFKKNCVVCESRMRRIKKEDLLETT